MRATLGLNKRVDVPLSDVNVCHQNHREQSEPTLLEMPTSVRRKSISYNTVVYFDVKKRMDAPENRCVQKRLTSLSRVRM